MACIHLQKSDIASEEQQFPKNISIFFAALAKEPMKQLPLSLAFFRRYFANIN